MLVDGEHYPPVVRAAVEELRAGGRQVVGAALLGGQEKLRDGGADFGAPVVAVGPPAVDALRAALKALAVDEVVDLSDEPVLDARTRMLLAAHTLAWGIPYRGADFSFEPPRRPRIATKPSIAVIGTGKRTGKTAVAAELARLSSSSGRPPVVVAMGRGGPEEPELVDPVTARLDPESLLALSGEGRHAASDHLEDALMAGVATVGTRRCGGGLAGSPFTSTFGAGVALANSRPEPLLIFVGSGTAIPPVHANATVCCVPAGADPELVSGYLGAYRLLLSDLVVITMCEASSARSGALALLEERIRGLVPGMPLVRTTFRPRPLQSIHGRSVFFATTAPEAVSDILVAFLEDRHGATVVGLSNGLADRERLVRQLDSAGSASVLLTELKAAAVDVATRVALGRGMQVIYCDNQLEVTEGDRDFSEFVAGITDLAVQRFATEGA
ncbi:MAG: 2,3-diphosphoglycerate synthetase [Acidimicrobiia bacterium]